MKQRLSQIKEMLDHPANRAHRISAFVRYLKWNVGRRLLADADYAINIAPSVQVILSNRENYATWAYTCGLYDYEDMHFLIDCMRPGDVFGDFGANVGVYSVLAGSLGATVLAVEPVPDTYVRLQRNLQLNGVKGRAVQCGLSNASGTLRFTVGLGGMNRVATPLARDSQSLDVEVHTVDELVSKVGIRPQFVKIDVEGFELPLLQGGSGLLAELTAIVIELNGSGKVYGRSDAEVHALLVEAGFGCFDYLPETREVRVRNDYQRRRANSLYINLRTVDDVHSRLADPSSSGSSRFAQPH